MKYEEFVSQTKTIPRAATTRHAHILYGLVRWLQPKVVVEVGSWFGYTAVWMARALQENGEGRLFCVDDFSLDYSSYETLNRNLLMCGVMDVVTVVPSKSSEFEWPKCDLAFIDGDHSYEGCWRHFLKAEASGASCIVIHDTTAWEGPRRVVEHPRYGFGMIEDTFDEGLSILKRKGVKPAPRHPAEQKELTNVT